MAWCLQCVWTSPTKSSPARRRRLVQVQARGATSEPLFTAEHRALVPSVEVETWDRLERAAHEILAWNDKVNVISRKDLDAQTLVERHYLPSLALLNVEALRERWNTVSPRKCSVLDAGTGGGFPGLPLAIARPNASFTLADGRGKKVMVVDQCARAARATNARAEHGRVPEHFAGRAFDFVLGRSVAALPDFVDAVTPVLSRPDDDGDGLLSSLGGVLYVKGGDFESELDALGVAPRWDLPILGLLGDNARGIGADKRLLYFPTRDLLRRRRRR